MPVLRLIVAVLFGGNLLLAEHAFSQEKASSGPQCTNAGSNFTRLGDLNICARIGLDTTAEVGHQFSQYHLYVEMGRGDDRIPWVSYGAFARDSDRHKVVGNLLIRPNLALFAPTEYGPLSINVRTSANSVAEDLTRVATGPLFVDDAWASFGPLTLGRRFSYFDYNPGFTYKPGYTSYRTTNLLAVTVPVTGSVEASLSIEDPSSRRREDGVWAAFDKARVPDLVGAFRINGNAANAQASVAVRQISQMDGLGCPCPRQKGEGGAAGSAAFEYRHKFGETYGRVMVAGAVAQGALDYLGIPSLAPDYIADADGALRATRGVSALASYEHVWRPDLRTAFSFSWYGTNSAASDLRWQAQGYLSQLTVEYMPAPNLFVGAEASHLSDVVKATSADTSGVSEHASMDRLLVYVRRFF